MFILGRMFTFPDGLRFILEKDAPFFVFAALFYQDELRIISRFPLARKLYAFLLLFFCVILGFITATGLITSRSFTAVFNLKWSYEAYVQWSFTILLFRYLFTKRTTQIESWLLAILTTYIAGWIYELPNYYRANPHVGIYFHYAHPFILASRWIMAALLTAYLWKHFKLTRRKIWLIALIGLGCFSLFYGYDRFLFRQFIPRLPTIGFFAVTIYLLKRKEVTNYEKKN